MAVFCRLVCSGTGLYNSVGYYYVGSDYYLGTLEIISVYDIN